MVKCTCGSRFKNFGKLVRHLYKMSGSSKHEADLTHEETAREHTRYLKGSK